MSWHRQFVTLSPDAAEREIAEISHMPHAQKMALVDAINQLVVPEGNVVIITTSGHVSPDSASVTTSITQLAFLADPGGDAVTVESANDAQASAPFRDEDADTVADLSRAAPQ